MTPIPPGATLGVMGGGQLGRMFVHAAQRLGYSTAVLDPDPFSPAGLVSHRHIQTGFIDEKGLAELAMCSAAITTEFENVPAQALRTLAASRPVAPSATAVAIAQDRILEKQHFARCGVACAPHAVIESQQQLQAVSGTLLPGILKTARLGYDGKGQQRVATQDELARAWSGFEHIPCVLEKMLPLAAECSVIVARGADGQMVCLPPQLNLHRGGILAVTQVHEGNIPAAIARKAQEATEEVATGLDYVGVLCVEFFVLDDGTLVVNEMAPRPHNSGHWSLDGCDVSQFELQVRTLAGLPLAQPRQHSPAIMLNLLGELWLRQDSSTKDQQAPQSQRPQQLPAEPFWADVLALAGTHLHLYGKQDARIGRKMGHLNITAASVEAARTTALEACRLLGIDAF